MLLLLVCRFWLCPHARQQTAPYGPHITAPHSQALLSRWPRIATLPNTPMMITYSCWLPTAGDVPVLGLDFTPEFGSWVHAPDLKIVAGAELTCDTAHAR